MLSTWIHCFTRVNYGKLAQKPQCHCTSKSQSQHIDLTLSHFTNPENRSDRWIQFHKYILIFIICINNNKLYITLVLSYRLTVLKPQSVKSFIFFPFSLLNSFIVRLLHFIELYDSHTSTTLLCRALCALYTWCGTTIAESTSSGNEWTKKWCKKWTRNININLSRWFGLNWYVPIHMCAQWCTWLWDSPISHASMDDTYSS